MDVLWTKAITMSAVTHDCALYPKDPGASAEWWHGHPEAQMVAKEWPVWPVFLSGHKAERRRPGHKELCRSFLYPGCWNCPLLLYSYAGDVVEQEERLPGPIKRGTWLRASALSWANKQVVFPGRINHQREGNGLGGSPYFFFLWILKINLWNIKSGDANTNFCFRTSQINEKEA